MTCNKRDLVVGPILLPYLPLCLPPKLQIGFVVAKILFLLSTQLYEGRVARRSSRVVGGHTCVEKSLPDQTSEAVADIMESNLRDRYT